jgi:Sulfotransferase family
LLARCIGGHPRASCLENTNVPEDEGQHLQGVYQTARALGGPGRFGFSRAAHLTEASRPIERDGRAKLIASWRPFWDISQPVLVEKSPPNLLRMRFLQALFPSARFVMIVRHPVAVTAATRKWSGTSVLSLLRHWFICHQHFLRDTRTIRHVLLVRYEDLVSNPIRVLSHVFNFLGLDPTEPSLEIRRGINESYFRWWDAYGLSGIASTQLSELERMANAFGYSVEAPRATIQPSSKVSRLLGTWD